MHFFCGSKLKQGFTLVEIIITIALAAILLTIAVPSFTSLIESNKERTTRDALVSSIYAAQQQAQSARVNVYLCPTEDGTSCVNTTNWGADWLVYEDNDNSGGLNNSDIIVMNTSSKTKLISSTVSQIRFTPTGHSTANTFQICSNTDNTVIYNIQLSVMGRISYATASGGC